METYDPAASVGAGSIETMDASITYRAHKFGGSSVADAERYRHVAALLQDSPAPRVVVVSAMQGVTDALIALADAASRGGDWQAEWSQLRRRHLAEAERLDPRNSQALAAWFDSEFSSLWESLGRIAGAGELNDHAIAAIQGLGEVWSSRLLQAALGGEASGWARLDARDVLVVHPGELGVAIDWPRTRALFAGWRAVHAQRDVVVTGFVARDTGYR